MSLNGKIFGSNFHGYNAHLHHCIIWVNKGDYITPTLLNRASFASKRASWPKHYSNKLKTNTLNYTKQRVLLSLVLIDLRRLLHVYLTPDGWYLSNVSIIFDCSMLLYYLFWMFMGFTIHFYIIFGTNLLTRGPTQIAVFLPILVFRRKRISNGRNETFRRVIFGTNAI